MRNLREIASLTFLATATLVAHADTIYSQFGPGQTFTSSGYVIGSVATANQLIAIPFIPTETATLSDAVLPMRQFPSSGFPGNNPATVFIESSVAGAPGAILDTLTQVGTQSPTASLVDFTCASCSVLSAGTTYFLVAYQPDAATTDVWNKFNLTTKGTVYDNQEGSPTGPWEESNDLTTAFEVNGTTAAPGVTPEPSSLVLLGTGILGLANAARRKFHRS